MRSRLGGPFAGSAESTSFSLWGCSAYTPVEGVFFASITDPLVVTLRWSAEYLGSADGFNIYRSTSEDGLFGKINEEILDVDLPGVYVDRAVWAGTEFWYELYVVRPDGSEEKVGFEAVSVTTGGRLVTRLFPPSPNPFRGETVIMHDIAAAVGVPRLTIYDVSGRVVKTFSGMPTRTGRYEVIWDGTNDNGQHVGSGVYFCSLENGESRETRRIVLLK
ncbi:T9SS type A sorting domain-containing protein [bacterium]|nr:T9SS type A sorting domain-containing protein [bacterium]